MEPDFNKISEQSTKSTQDFSSLIFKELVDLDKHKNTWIAQLITISSSLLGGLYFLKNNPNIIAIIGFLILFSTIIFGLSTIMKNINKLSDNLSKTMFKQYDINNSLLFLNYCQQKITNKVELNEEEKKKKIEIEKNFMNFMQDIGIIDDQGNLRMITDDIKNAKIENANYILIYGFTTGVILIALSNYWLQLFNCLINYLNC